MLSIFFGWLTFKSIIFVSIFRGCLSGCLALATRLAHSRLIKIFYLLDQGSILALDVVSHLIDPFEEVRELREQVDDLADDNHTKLHSLALSSESLDHEFESYLLQGAIYDPILYDCTIELGYLLQILDWVLVEETVLVEKTV